MPMRAGQSDAGDKNAKGEGKGTKGVGKGENPRLDPKFAATFRLWDSLKLYCDGLEGEPNKDQFQMIGQTAFILIKPYLKQDRGKSSGKGKKAVDSKEVEAGPSSLTAGDPLIAAHRFPSPYRPTKAMLDGKDPEERKQVQKAHNTFIKELVEKSGKQLAKIAKTSSSLHDPPEGSKTFKKTMAAINAAKVSEFYEDGEFWEKFSKDTDLRSEHFSKHTIRCFLAFREMHKQNAANMFNTIATNWIAVMKDVPDEVGSPPINREENEKLPDEKAVIGVCPSILFLASSAFRKSCKTKVYKDFMDAIKNRIESAKASNEPEQEGEVSQAEG